MMLMLSFRYLLSPATEASFLGKLISAINIFMQSFKVLITDNCRENF